MINAVALAITHAASAPMVLTLVVPAVLCAACLTRLVFWYRRASLAVTPEQAARQLQTMVRLTVPFGVGFTSWSLSLFPYGDAYAQCHVAFYMAITLISSIFCLMHLKNAASLLAVVVAVPFTIFFCRTGHVVLTAIALNFLLVVGGVGWILLRNYRDFTDLITSKRNLQSRQVETQRLNEANFRLANEDGLTGLPNRRRFMALLSATHAEAEADTIRFAVVVVDLDGFKAINDIRGHATGDLLLTEVGFRLRQMSGPTVTVARLGGDEFGMILSGNPNEADIVAFGETVCALLGRPYLIFDFPTDISASAGLVSYPDGALTPEQLFDRADYALYHAKKMQRGTAVLFSDEHETMIRQATRLETALQHADLETELSVAFQPILDAVSGRAIAFEALARWDSPVVGPVAPDVFIRIAEHAGFIGNLTEILLVKALTAAAAWPAFIRLSFNLSALDLTTTTTVTAVRRIIRESPVARARIDFEVTETAVMINFDKALQTLKVLKEDGVNISLDDFGTGYSSLSQVHRLRPDTIKIDRSFVADILENQDSRDIIISVVDLCRRLRIGCIVEGVETTPQLQTLIELGGTTVQGYLFAKPMPASHVACYLAQEAALPFPARPRLASSVG